MFRAAPALPYLICRPRAACAALLLGAALPCSGATQAELFNTVVTARFVKQEQCNVAPILRTRMRQGLNMRFDVSEQSTLSREQVRHIALRYDEIGTRHCTTVAPLLSTDAALARNYGQLRLSSTADPHWESFLADENARKWAAITASFRTGLIALGGVLDLALSLRRDVVNADGKPLRDPLSQASRQLMDEIRKVSLTDEEAKVRFLLASLAGEPALRDMIPARFNLDSQVRIEARTRQLGLQLVDRHRVDLRTAYDRRTRALLLMGEEKGRERQLDAAFRSASGEVDALASQYRRR